MVMRACALLVCVQSLGAATGCSSSSGPTETAKATPQAQRGPDTDKAARLAPSLYLTRATQNMYRVVTARNEFLQVRPTLKTEQDAQTAMSKFGAAMLASKKDDSTAYAELEAAAKSVPIDASVLQAMVPIHDQIQNVTAEYLAFASTAGKDRFARAEELSQGFDARVAAASRAIAKSKESRS